MIAFADGAGLHRDDVRADFRLGHAHAAHRLAVHSGWQDAVALTVVAVDGEVLREEDAVCQHGEAKSWIRGGERFHHLNRCRRVEPCATELLWNRDA